MGLFYKYYEINIVNCSLADNSKGALLLINSYLEPVLAQSIVFDSLYNSWD